MKPGDTGEIRPAVTPDECAVTKYLAYLESTGAFSERWLEVERSWASQQAPGVVSHIVTCIETILDYIKKDEAHE